MDNYIVNTRTITHRIHGKLLFIFHLSNQIKSKPIIDRKELDAQEFKKWKNASKVLARETVFIAKTHCTEKIIA